MARFLYHIITGCFAAMLILSCNTKQGTDKKVSLAETYSAKDTRPFGGYIARRQLENMFPLNNIREKKQSFVKTWDDVYSYDSASLYVCITPALNVNEEETKAMLDYVNAGNDLFISADYIDELLLKKTGCATSGSILSLLNDMRSTSITSIAGDSTTYSYFYLPFYNYFSSIRREDTKVLGYNDLGQPNFILHYYGKGRIYLHCDPRAFSNYFLLSKNNYRYMQSVFAYTSVQPDHLYWDDYYYKVKSRRNVSSDRGGSNSSDNGEGFSSLREINKFPTLAYAFWLSLALLVLYLVFGSKRRQRIVAQQKANENTSVTFTETIGRLYYQKKDNKNIADKMVTYFNEFIRNRYFISSNNADDDFITTLSRKSGVPRERVEILYRTMSHAQQADTVDDFQLLSLNEQIQYFYKIIKTG